MKISNLTTKTSIEIQDTDLLVIEDAAETKSVTIKEFREYLMNNGITKSTKLLINEMVDNFISSLQSAKFLVSDLFTYVMNVTINDAESGDILIALKDNNTDKWLAVEDMVALLAPNEDGYATKEFVINVLIDDVYVKSSSYTIYDASALAEIVPEGSVGYIVAHFDGLTQNQIASISYDDIIITLESNEVTISLPIEDRHEYNFVGDLDLFKNNVSYIL